MFDIITIGTATRDAFIKSKYFKLMSSPDFAAGDGLCLPAGSKIEVEDIFFATGGGATNAAVTFARQGFKTAALCKVGDDVSGREVMANLQSENISAEFSVQDKNLKTAYSILILSEDGERTVLVYRGASDKFEPADIPADLRAKWFYLAGSLPVGVLNKILEIAQASKTKIAFNPSHKEIQLGLKGLGEIIKKTDVLILNREEGAVLTGLDYKHEDKIFRKLNEYAGGILVVTDGEKGALVSDGRVMYRSGIFKEQCRVDKTGAGDAFGSGLVAGLMKNDNIEQAIRLANANATSVVEKISAKAGILPADDFETNPRWQKGLEISKTEIK